MPVHHERFDEQPNVDLWLASRSGRSAHKVTLIKPFNNEGFIEIPVVWRSILGNRREVNLLLSIVVGVVVKESEVTND